MTKPAPDADSDSSRTVLSVLNNLFFVIVVLAAAAGAVVLALNKL